MGRPSTMARFWQCVCLECMGLQLQQSASSGENKNQF